MKNRDNSSNIIKMTMRKSRRKLQAAESDYKNKFYDDSVSRSYYAVFHSISAVLLSKKMTFSAHYQTIGALNREFVKTKIFPRGFTKTINKLFDERQTGDYDSINYIDKDTTKEDLDAVERIVKACEEYLLKWVKSRK